MPSLAEQYRPTNFDSVVGQPKAVAVCKRLAAKGIGGTAILLTGGTGTGKTTLARILASHHASELVREIDATGLTANEIEEIARKASGRSLYGHGFAVIINEIHGLTPSALRKLLTVLESPTARNTLWVFTTTLNGADELAAKSDDFRPFIGRCVPIQLQQRGLCEAFAARAKEVAMAEGLDGKPIEAYTRLAKDCRNSLREMLSRIEAGCMIAD